MRPRVQTCLLLLVGVLTSSGSGGTIGSKDGSIYFESDGDTESSGEGQIAHRPHWKVGPWISRLRNVRVGNVRFGGTRLSRVTLQETQPTTVEPLPATSTGAVQQLEVRPLLDEDQLVAFQVNKQKTTLPPPANTSAQTTAVVPVAAAASSQTGGDKDFSSGLADVLGSIFDEADARQESTTRRPWQPTTQRSWQPTTQQLWQLTTQKLWQPPTRVDVVSQKPLVGSAANAAEYHEFLPHIEEILEDAFASPKPQEPQPQPQPATHLPLPQTPKVPPPPAVSTGNASEFHEFFPEIEEVLKSVLVNPKSEEPQPHPTTHLSPAQTPKIPPPVGSPGNVSKFQEFLPQIEEVLKSILINIKSEEPQPHRPVSLPPPQTPKVPSTDTKEDFKHILPALEQAIGSILETSDVKETTTSSRPVLPPVRPPTTHTKEEFAAVLPQLEDAIRSILEEAASEQRTTAQQQQHPTTPSGWQPNPPTTNNYNFNKFLPKLEQLLGDIIRNRMTDPTSTAKLPIFSVTAPTDQQSNNIVPDTYS